MLLDGASGSFDELPRDPRQLTLDESADLLAWVDRGKAGAASPAAPR